MANSPTTVLRQVIRHVAKGDQPDVTDRELLRRFGRDNNQGAFATLVGRHGGMVQGVCRRVLPTVQDAEDACQATFLLLAQKAGSQRWQSSVANWLYTTARRVARNARVVAQRRARREARVAVLEAVQPVDVMTGRELLATLDEELDKLPPIYREALVLCYLEGLTGDEAAAQLGVPAATLRTRVKRGRKHLHDALTRSGCALGAGLLALAVTSPARASSPRLIQAVLAAVSGCPPAAVAELAKGVAVNEVMKKAVLALAAAVAVVALGIGVGALKSTAAGQPPDKPVPAGGDKGQAKDAKPAPDTPKKVAVSGRVLGPDGQPLAGAKLVLLHWDNGPADLGTSGADGRFKVEVPADRRATYLVARAEGFGVDFSALGRDDRGQEAELRLVKDHAVSGRVVDTQGKPVAGAKVVATKLEVYEDNSLAPFLAEWKAGQRVEVGLVKLVWRADGVLLAATTGADGRFSLPGGGAERVLTLRVRGTGIAESEVLVANRDGLDPKPYNQARADRLAEMRVARTGMSGTLLSGPDVSVVAEAEKPVRGVVKDADTGKPRAGVRVFLKHDEGERLVPPLRATTDAEGRFEVRGAHKARSYALEVEDDLEAAYVGAYARAADTAGYEPVTIDVKVKKGVIITGKVINAATKKALPGVASVAVLSDNPFVKDYPELTSRGLYPQATGEDGTFRLMTIPGPVLLMGGPDYRRLPDGLAANGFLPAVPDPKYPQYFDKRFNGRAYFGVGGTVGFVQGNFCKVLELKPDAGVVTQDILVEPAQ
jgi:RNA polymerase sigma factor (sigma-70 family)